MIIKAIFAEENRAGGPHKKMTGFVTGTLLRLFSGLSGSLNNYFRDEFINKLIRQ